MIFINSYARDSLMSLWNEVWARVWERLASHASKRAYTPGY